MPSDISTLLEVLQGVTSQKVVKEFLRSKNLPFSATSWTDLAEQRILPKLESAQLSFSDLVDLLREAEEHGRQHVFLYQCTRDRAASLADQPRITKILKRRNAQSILDTPLILDQPPVPTLVDVRWQHDREGTSLVIKFVERRSFQRYVDTVPDGRYVVRRYEQILSRAVNLAKLHSNGLLELRVFSHANSTNYDADLTALWELIADFLPQSDFSEVSLAKLKDNIWKKRQQLRTEIRISDASLRNDLDTLLRGATGDPDADLTADPAATRSLDGFLAMNGYCDASNIWILQQQNGPSRHIHVLLSGRPNEFAVTVSCSGDDYDCVLRHIKRNSR